MNLKKFLNYRLSIVLESVKKMKKKMADHSIEYPAGDDCANVGNLRSRGR